MPYVSAKQRAYMHIHHPKIAAQWDKETGGKIHKSKVRSAAHKALGGKY